MSKVKKKIKKNGSFILNLINSFTAFIYSLFANGRLGSWLSWSDGDESIFSKTFEKISRAYQKSSFSGAVDLFMQNSKFMVTSDAIRSFLARIGLGVYGLFFSVYGTVSAFVYFIPIFVAGNNDHGESALIVAIITAVCAIPLTVSSKSLMTNISESRLAKKIVSSLFAVPVEKLKPENRLGGAVQMIIAAFLGLGCAGVTYFLHTSYIFVLIAMVLVWCLITANPESGVVLTLLAVPFLQYTNFSTLILLALIILTTISFVSKVMKRRRVLFFSADGLIAVIFCGFILVSGAFSAGGMRTLVDSLLSVIIILGAFITTFNLMRGKRLLGSCVKIVAISFAFLAVLGVWNVFYDGIVDGVTYSIRDYVQPIFEGNNLYIADNASVFSVLAILSFPFMFCFMARQKNVRNTVGLLLISLIMFGSCFIYGTYETVLAIIIEFFIFWIIYSHKTLNVLILMLVPTGLLLIIFPYAAQYFDLPALINTLSQYLPVTSPDSAYYSSVSSSTINMLADIKSGIGAGAHAFASSVAPYLEVAAEGAQKPGSFWLQILCWSGTGGFVTFLVFIGSMFKKSLGFLAVSRDTQLRSETLALIVGLAVAVLFGGVNCLWDDPRMLYLFWAMAGLLAAYVREGKELEDRHSAELSDEINETDVELIFHK